MTKVCCKHLVKLSTFFSVLQNLKQLNLEGCQLYDVEGIQDVKTLTDLNLSSTLLSTEAISRLQGLSQLKSLKLSNMPEVSCNRALLFLSGKFFNNFIKISVAFNIVACHATPFNFVYFASFEGLKLKEISLPNQATLTDRGVQYLSSKLLLNVI